MRVAIVGAGLIGRSWAIVFARAGWDVALFDAGPGQCERAREQIAAGLEELAAHGLVSHPRAAAAKVRIAADLADAVSGVDLVQESVSETREHKQAIFRSLEDAAPRTAILASSTSAIVASLFTEPLETRERCLIAHPVNPPHLVPVVELCGAPWTSADTLARARALYESVGQVPVMVKREIDGFILNRLQGALLAEAFRLVGDGFVSPQDLDKTLKDGLGLRWSFMGPFETIELNAPGGIRDYCARYGDGLQRRQAEAAGPEAYGAESIDRIMDEWAAAPDPDRLEARSRWRDRRLAALLAHKRGQQTGGS
jgi:3-hydroxyacyl-CoA dehydrogenase